MEFLEDARRLAPQLIEIRRELHREPEIGLSLPATQAVVLRELAGLPVEVRVGDELSSVVAVLHGRSDGDAAVLLRSDMDALPGVEAAAVEYRASNGAMHACGHDMHIAMLLGAVHLLSGVADRLRGDVVFMFQPGEEGYNGAQRMLAEGLFTASPRPIRAAYALHVLAGVIPRGVFGCRPGTVLAAISILRVTITGKGGHAALPHLARDPVPATCSIVLALQSLVARRFDVFDPVIVTISNLHAGDAANVIPEVVTFDACLRAFSHDGVERVVAGVREVIESGARAHGVLADVDVVQFYPPTVNDPASVAGVRDCVTRQFGADRYLPLEQPLAGSEDFAYVLDRVPGAMVLLGAHPEEHDPATAAVNHSPDVIFDDAVLMDGAALYAALAMGHLDAVEPAGTGGPLAPTTVSAR